MVKIECFKVKSGKIKKIPKSKCSRANIKKLNNQGYSVSKSTTKGNKTKIETFSALTRQEAIKEHRKRFGNLPF